MAGIQQSHANSVLDSELAGTLYLAVFTTAPTASSGGVEVTGGSYARQSFTFAAASAGSKANSATITFAAATADWGGIVAWAVMTALTGGTIKSFRSFTSFPVNNGDQLIANAGTIIVTLA